MELRAEAAAAERSSEAGECFCCVARGRLVHYDATKVTRSGEAEIQVLMRQLQQEATSQCLSFSGLLRMWMLDF